MDDRALAAAILRGEVERFADLVDRETGAVYRVCLRVLGDAHEAEDATQEAFLTAYRSLGSYRGDGPLRAWLLRTASRLAFRRLSRRRPVQDLDAASETYLADVGSDPARVSLETERQRVVRRAVAALPDKYREVVALRFFAELSLEEIADATGRPLNTVKTRLRRGIDRLRPDLGSEAYR